jgi:hypothetical protein
LGFFPSSSKGESRPLPTQVPTKIINLWFVWINDFKENDLDFNLYYIQEIYEGI